MSEKLTEISRFNLQANHCVTAGEIWQRRNPGVPPRKNTHQVDIPIWCPDCRTGFELRCPGYATLNDITRVFRERYPPAKGRRCGCHGWESVEITSLDVPNPFPTPFIGRERARKSSPETD